MTIRPATESDWPAIRELFRRVCAAGDSFAFDADTPEATARKLWFDPPATAFVAEDDGVFLGTYFGGAMWRTAGTWWPRRPADGACPN